MEQVKQLPNHIWTELTADRRSVTIGIYANGQYGSWIMMDQKMLNTLIENLVGEYAGMKPGGILYQ